MSVRPELIEVLSPAETQKNEKISDDETSIVRQYVTLRMPR